MLSKGGSGERSRSTAEGRDPLFRSDIVLTTP